MYAGRARAIIERSLIALRSSTWVPVATGFVEPVLYLLAFGYGMGELIGNVTLGDRAVDYTVFIAPGLLAASAMNGAIYDSTWNVFFKLNESKLYQGMLATPLGPLDVALGEIVWALFRGLSYSIAFMLITAPLGLVPSWGALLAIPAAVLIAFGFASFGMAITSYFKTYQQMGLINIALLPMFLFSGSLYPISVYPDWLELTIKLLPTWHGIELTRDIWFGIIDFSSLSHLSYFLVMIVLGLFFTTRRLRDLFMR
ncbi:MAG: ABC transporter [Actinobacteria bacterium]|nr:ABC transporter [Actinomycetota bacterium]